ncbi:hypothetical protein [Nostoc sp. UHCC 0252]|uniref:hypothetical protein n=1 Tax=Nostoc sp. UHCC 0252 TaxID=3110241 RepID=UPI002B215E4B|nr:hypothetical protein [Nostoc sp. UHCC 0252]MEA5605899.1 hypothetical protein [Nostoc sp. UHCC 0252]
MRLFVPLGVANSTIGFPGLLPLLRKYVAGIISNEVGDFMMRPAFLWVAFLGSVSPWELPVSASVIPQRTSGCALFLASPSRYRV